MERSEDVRKRFEGIYDAVSHGAFEHEPLIDDMMFLCGVIVGLQTALDDARRAVFRATGIGLELDRVADASITDLQELSRIGVEQYLVAVARIKELEAENESAAKRIDELDTEIGD